MYHRYFYLSNNYLKFSVNVFQCSRVEKQPEKPSIDLSKIKDITIIAGQDLKMAIPITGHPTPTVSWEQNGSPVDKTRSKLDVSGPWGLL